MCLTMFIIGKLWWAFLRYISFYIFCGNTIIKLITVTKILEKKNEDKKTYFDS